MADVLHVVIPHSFHFLVLILYLPLNPFYFSLFFLDNFLHLLDLFVFEVKFLFQILNKDL